MRAAGSMMIFSMSTFGLGASKGTLPLSIS